MKNTIIFDLDGTLLNTLEDLCDAVNYAMNNNGFPERTLQEVRNFVGNGVRVLVKRAAPSTVTNDEYEKCYADFKVYYTKNMENKTAPYLGINDCINALKSEGFKMAIVTNKADYAAIPLCKKMFPAIDVVIGTSETVEPKPKPDGVYKALELLNSSKENSYYVGDSEVDAQTAHNAGLDLISVLWGFRDEYELRKLGLEVFAKTPKDLQNMLISGKIQ